MPPLVPEVVSDFAWSVQTIRRDDGEVDRRELVIQVMVTMTIQIQTDEGVQRQQVEVEGRRIILPFGRNPSGGMDAWERCGLALAGRDVPPEIQTAKSLAGIQLPDNGRKA